MKNSGLKIGATFSIISFLLTFTLIIPFYSVVPGELLMQYISEVFENLSHQQAGLLTIFIFTVVFLLSLIFIFKRVKTVARANQKLKTSDIILSMIVLYVIVHNLGYHLLLGISGFPIDALNLVAGIISFPFSSLCFVIIGFLMDRYWKKTHGKIVKCCM